MPREDTGEAEQRSRQVFPRLLRRTVCARGQSFIFQQEFILRDFVPRRENAIRGAARDLILKTAFNFILTDSRRELP